MLFSVLAGMVSSLTYLTIDLLGGAPSSRGPRRRELSRMKFQGIAYRCDACEVLSSLCVRETGTLTDGSFSRDAVGRAFVRISS